LRLTTQAGRLCVQNTAVGVPFPGKAG
jgi:hypothetical protein